MPGDGGPGVAAGSDGELTLLNGDGGGGLRVLVDEEGMFCELDRGVADPLGPVLELDPMERVVGGRYSIGVGV